MTDMHTAASASGPADHEASGQAPRDGSGSAGGDTPNAPGGPETRPSARKRRLVLWQPEVWIPLALLAVFLVLWALVLARPTFLTSFDLWLRDHVQDAAHADRDGAHRWRLIKGVADLGGGVAVPGVSVHVQLPTVALGAVALIAAAARRSWRPLAAAALGYAALGLVLFLKAVGDRPGPSMAGQALTDQLGYFPSGHTGNTMLCYGTSALILAFVFTKRWMRAVIATAMTLLALAVGFALVWMDYHWLSDVLGSYALGGAALFGVARVLVCPDDRESVPEG